MSIIKETNLISPYRKDKIIRILNEQVEHNPKLIKSIITFKYSGMSKVCGDIANNSFELRNRKNHFLSLRAKGVLTENRKLTTINVQWVKPKYYYFWIVNVLLGSFDNDKKIILDFLENWLDAKSPGAGLHS